MSQLQLAMMSWGCSSAMIRGIEVGQLVAVVRPNPSIVLVCTVASPVADRAAVMPKEASCMTESPRITTRSGWAGETTVPLGSVMGTSPE